MQPVNTKSLFSILCNTIEKLEKNEITPTQAMAVAKVTAQANQLLTYELKRAALMTNEQFAKNHRNIEISNFTSIKENDIVIGRIGE
jgi:hypothetical protein